MDFFFANTCNNLSLKEPYLKFKIYLMANLLTLNLLKAKYDAICEVFFHQAIKVINLLKNTQFNNSD